MRECTRGKAARVRDGNLKGCEHGATRFFQLPGCSFCYAACPEHAESPHRGYVEITEDEFDRIKTGTV